MKRLRTFLIYIIWIVLFWILTDFLINVGINSTYKSIERLDNNTQIEVYQADATVVNGRIFGALKNKNENNISGKYIKINLYSERKIDVGCRYIDIGELKEDETKPLEIYFKTDNVKYYSLNIVNEKGLDESSEIHLLDKELTTSDIVMGVIIFLIIW